MMSVSLGPDLCVAVVIQTENNVKGGSIYFGHFRDFSPLCPGWHNRIEKLSPQWAGKQRKGDYPSSTFFVRAFCSVEVPSPKDGVVPSRMKVPHQLVLSGNRFINIPGGMSHTSP